MYGGGGELFPRGPGHPDAHAGAHVCIAWARTHARTHTSYAHIRMEANEEEEEEDDDEDEEDEEGGNLYYDESVVAQSQKVE